MGGVGIGRVRDKLHNKQAKTTNETSPNKSTQIQNNPNQQTALLGGWLLAAQLP